MGLSNKRFVMLIQGVYYTVTGIWPLIDVHSFEVVTGKKKDKFTLRTTAILITVIGVILTWGSRLKKPAPGFTALGASSAAALASMEILHSNQIRPVYLAESVLEILLAILLVLPSRVKTS